MIKKTSETTPTMASVVNTTNSSTTDAYSCDYINDLVDYSTTEIKTGAKWINGKPVYRKVYYNAGTLSYTNNKATIPTGLSNVDNVITIYGSVVDSLTGVFPLPYSSTTDLTHQILLRFGNDGNIIIEQNVYNDRLTKYIIIVEYTKTTD